MSRIAMTLLPLLLAATPAAADCLEDMMGVSLAGEARQVDQGWVLVLDRAECLVIPADTVRADGTVRWRMLPGTYDWILIDWQGADPVAGRVVLDGLLVARPNHSGTAEEGPPFTLRVERPAAPD